MALFAMVIVGLLTPVSATASSEVGAAAASGRALPCVRAARTAGFGGNGWTLAVAVALAESRCNPAAVHHNPGSVDRGAWQINSHWHAEVSVACAFNLQCSANETYRISKHGTDFHEWSTFKNNSYRQFLGEAADGIRDCHC